MAHMLQDSIPAWSSHSRNVSQVFGKWVFDTNIQCKSASVDTAVCADVSTIIAGTPDATTESSIQAVIPWLGGDYNPW
jgi:hypothetical protein